MDQDHEGLEVINQASEPEEVVGEQGGDDLDIRDLYSGVQSLIQADQPSVEDVTLTKPGLAAE